MAARYSVFLTESAQQVYKVAFICRSG